jgi:hypothetical protein
VGDRYEQEADRVAAAVVQRINAPQGQPIQRQAVTEEEEDETLRRKPSAASTDLIQRQEVAEEEEDETLQRKPVTTQPLTSGGVTISPDIEATIQQARGRGQALPRSLQTSMEPAFGVDLSQVRVHHDPQANQIAQTIQAHAFTTGRDVFFRQGAYNPASQEGQTLIAHELTHVLQQNRFSAAARPKMPAPVDSPQLYLTAPQPPARSPLQSNPLSFIQRKVFLAANKGKGQNTAKNLKAAADRLKGHPERLGAAMVTVEQRQPGYLSKKITDYKAYIDSKSIGALVQTPIEYLRGRSATKRGIITERPAIKKGFGTTKNKTKYRVYDPSGGHRDRIPDSVTPNAVIDIKNVSRLTLTDQLKDFEIIAHRAKHSGVRVTTVAKNGTEKAVNKDRKFILVVRSAKHPQGATDVELVVELLADKVEYSLDS